MVGISFITMINTACHDHKNNCLQLMFRNIIERNQSFLLFSFYYIEISGNVIMIFSSSLFYLFLQSFIQLSVVDRVKSNGSLISFDRSTRIAPHTHRLAADDTVINESLHCSDGQTFANHMKKMLLVLRTSRLSLTI